MAGKPNAVKWSRLVASAAAYSNAMQLWREEWIAVAMVDCTVQTTGEPSEALFFCWTTHGGRKSWLYAVELSSHVRLVDEKRRPRHWLAARDVVPSTEASFLNPSSQHASSHQLFLSLFSSQIYCWCSCRIAVYNKYPRQLFTARRRLQVQVRSEALARQIEVGTCY